MTTAEVRDDIRDDIVGLVPAAGTASRLGRLPCSKEILPVEFQPGGADASPRSRVAADWLLEGMGQGGADRAIVVLRAGKWDIQIGRASCRERVYCEV